MQPSNANHMFDYEKCFQGEDSLANFMLQRKKLYECNIAQIKHCAVYDDTCNKYVFENINCVSTYLINYVVTHEIQCQIGIYVKYNVTNAFIFIIALVLANNEEEKMIIENLKKIISHGLSEECVEKDIPDVGFKFDLYQLDGLKSFYKVVKEHISKTKDTLISFSLNKNITDKIKNGVQKNERQEFLLDLIDNENIFLNKSDEQDIVFNYKMVIHIFGDVYRYENDFMILKISHNEKNNVYCLVEENEKCGIFITRNSILNVDKCDDSYNNNIIEGKDCFFIE